MALFLILLRASKLIFFVCLARVFGIGCFSSKQGKCIQTVTGGGESCFLLRNEDQSDEVLQSFGYGICEKRKFLGKDHRFGDFICMDSKSEEWNQTMSENVSLKAIFSEKKGWKNSDSMMLCCCWQNCCNDAGKNWSTLMKREQGTEPEKEDRTFESKGTSTWAIFLMSAGLVVVAAVVIAILGTVYRDKKRQQRRRAAREKVTRRAQIGCVNSPMYKVPGRPQMTSKTNEPENKEEGVEEDSDSWEREEESEESDGVSEYTLDDSSEYSTVSVHPASTNEDEIPNHSQAETKTSE